MTDGSFYAPSAFYSTVQSRHRNQDMEPEEYSFWFWSPLCGRSAMARLSKALHRTPRVMLPRQHPSRAREAKKNRCRIIDPEDQKKNDRKSPGERKIKRFRPHGQARTEQRDGRDGVPTVDTTSSLVGSLKVRRRPLAWGAACLALCHAGGSPPGAAANRQAQVTAAPNPGSRPCVCPTITEYSYSSPVCGGRGVPPPNQRRPPPPSQHRLGILGVRRLPRGPPAQGHLASHRRCHLRTRHAHQHATLGQATQPWNSQRDAAIHSRSSPLPTLSSCSHQRLSRSLADPRAIHPRPFPSRQTTGFDLLCRCQVTASAEEQPERPLATHFAIVEPPRAPRARLTFAAPSSSPIAHGPLPEGAAATTARRRRQTNAASGKKSRAAH